MWSCRSSFAKVLAVCIVAMMCGPDARLSLVNAADTEEHLWLTNDHVKVGLKKSSGGAVFWISPAGSDKSLINSFDRGRLVQQSWYGKPDGSLWNKQPWRWNPVQGGDWQGKSATVLEQRHEATTSWIKSTPVHWATGKDLTDCEMEQTVTLKDELIHIKYQFRYSGAEVHPAHHQELPAFFADASLATLIYYDGNAPWSNGELKHSQPRFPNQYGKIPEHWAAYVDSEMFGIGCFVPQADELTFYRYADGGEGKSNCSYFAPVRTLAVKPGFQWSYDVWITMGKVDEIRDRFSRLASPPKP